MEGLIILIVLAFGVVLLVLPVVAWVSSRQSARRLETLDAEVRLLREQLRILAADAPRSAGSKPGTGSVPDLAPKPESVPSPRPSPRPLPDPLPVSPAPYVVQPPVLAVPEPDASPSGVPASPPIPPVLPPVLPPLPPPSPAPSPAAPAFQWERFVGTKLVAWLGGLTLFLAAAYFVKYSFERNLIPPEVRVAAGFLLGLGLMIGGIAIRRKAYVVTSHTFCATGVVILYAASFACHGIYHFDLFTAFNTLCLMTLITASAFLLAVRMNALVVAVLGMLGGFLTPVLLSTGQDNPVGLFGYIALLDIGLVAVALVRPWPFLVAMAGVGTVLMQVGWSLKFLSPAKLEVAWVTQLGFDGLFLAGAEVARRRLRDSAWWPGTVATMALATMAYTTLLVWDSTMGQRIGVLGSMVLGADLCLLALVLGRPAWSRLQLAGGAVANAFLAIWILKRLGADNLYWGLGAVLVVAAVHSLLPVVLARRKSSPMSADWSHAFPALGLLLMLLPVLNLPALPWTVWPAIFLVDVIAFGVAVLTRSLVAILGVLLLTGLVAGSWILQMPSAAVETGVVVGVVGTIALLFLVLGRWAVRSILPALAAGGGDPGRAFELGGFRLGLSAEAGMALLPSMSAGMPFLLLILVVAHVPLPSPSPVFAVGLALGVVMLSIVRSTGQGALCWVGLLGSLLLQWVWFGRLMPVPGLGGTVVAWNLTFSALFLIFPFLFPQACRSSLLPWTAAALSLPLHFGMLHRAVVWTWPNEFMGLLPAALSLPLFAGLVATRRLLQPEDGPRQGAMAVFGGAALFLVTLVFPIQFERQWLTVAWALEGVALCWLFHRIPHPGLRWAGVGLLAVVFVRLSLNPEVLRYHPRSDMPLLNWYAYTYGIAIAACFMAARLLAPPRHLASGISLPPVLATFGTVLAFLLLNIQIADYFSRPGEPVLTFAFSNNLPRDMSYTIGWSVFALGLVVAGIRSNTPRARQAGLALIGVTLVKLFLHDLGELGQLYRVGAVAAVAVIAIVSSLLYQRFVAAEDARPVPPPQVPPLPPTSPGS